ncbi:unnamed protein product, partial [Callosobruchus maculatus]
VNFGSRYSHSHA